MNEIVLVALAIPLGPQNDSNIHTDIFIKNSSVSEDLKMERSAENSTSNSWMITLINFSTPSIGEEVKCFSVLSSDKYNFFAVKYVN